LPNSMGSKYSAIKWAIDNKVKTVLDVGAGTGQYYNEFLLQNYHLDKIDAVEVFEYYVNHYQLNNKYNNVFIKDVRNFDNFNYDLVILGDIVEHMYRNEAIAVWNKISKQAKYGFIQMPIGECHQSGRYFDDVDQSYKENIYETHLEPFNSLDDILNNFSYIHEYQVDDIIINSQQLPFQIGSFYAKFNN